MKGIFFKMATLKDVARKAGVSVPTVSRVINNYQYVREATKAKVLKAIDKLDYQPDIRAQSLRGLKTKVIGLIIPDRFNPYYEQLASELEDVCYEQGYGLLLCSSKNNPERELAYLNILERQKVEGVFLVLSTAVLTGQKLNNLIKRGIQVVLDEDTPGISTSVVSADFHMGACQAVEYFISLGHREIAFINGPMNVSSSIGRFKGYRDTLNKYELKISKDLIKEGEFTYETGYKRTLELLRKWGDRFTAIFCSDDLVALGVLRAIQDKGKSVPQDYSIIGFDNVYLGSIIEPSLTTIAQPLKKIASRVLKIIMRKKMTKDGSYRKGKVILPTKLIVRESCAPPSMGR